MGCHIPAQQDDYGIALRRDEAQHEYVLAPAVVTFWDSFAEGALRM